MNKKMRALLSLSLALTVFLCGSVPAYADDYMAYWRNMAATNPTQFKAEARSYQYLDFNTAYTDMDTYKNAVPMSISGNVADYNIGADGSCVGLIESITGFYGYTISFHANQTLPIAENNFATLYGVIDGYETYTIVNDWGIPKRVQTLSINVLIGETRTNFTGGDLPQDMKDLFFGTYDVVTGYLGTPEWEDTTPDPAPDLKHPEYNQTYVHRAVTVSDIMVDGVPIQVHSYYQTVAGTIVMNFRFVDSPERAAWYDQEETLFPRAWYESTHYYESITFDYDGTADFSVREHYPIVLTEDGFYESETEGMEYGSRDEIQADILNENNCLKIK